jgi:hypothetical protein
LASFSIHSSINQSINKFNIAPRVSMRIAGA